MWVSTDSHDLQSKSRFVVAATSYAGRDLYYINLFKLVPEYDDLDPKHSQGALYTE